MITKLKLKNFQLFKSEEINFETINLITGINYDDLNSSGNGSGKTTIINAILFALYGNVTNLNLTDLIKIGEKECSVELYCSLNSEHYRIIRNIPSELHIFKHDEEIKFNNATIAQNYLNTLFGDANYFRMYRSLDITKGMNLLGLGSISLRKTLMNLIDAYFIKIRVSLLQKKAEREVYSQDKRMYRFYLSKKRLSVLEEGLKKIQAEIITAHKDAEGQSNILNNYKSDLLSKEKILNYKNQEIKKLNNDYCPILNQKCSQLQTKRKEVESAKVEEMNNLKQELNEIANLMKSEEEANIYYQKVYDQLKNKEQLTKEYIMKLSEAFKFSDYKYSKADVQLYTDAIKVLDGFAAFYVQDWLSQLTIILNDLLKDINISIEFNSDKSFLTVKNNEQELKYEQLSSGQQTFLNCIFKVAVLLNEGITDGLIIIDEGIGTIDHINLNKLLTILKNLNYQVVLIYQNIDKEIPDVHYINVSRKDDVSCLL